MSAMRVLVLGASGYLGGVITRRLAAAGFEVWGTCRSAAGTGRLLPLDAADPDAPDALLDRFAPQGVVSCLRGPFEAQLRCHGRLAAYACRAPEVRVVYLSSANVFDGELTRPHTEAEPPCPKSDYGRFKAECEALLCRSLGPQCAVLRLPQVWGPASPRFCELRRAVAAGAPVDAAENLFLNAALDVQVACITESLLRAGGQGIYHVGTRTACGQAEFLRLVCARAGLAAPALRVERLPENEYFAVLPDRGDAPPAAGLELQELLAAFEAPGKAAPMR